MPKNATTPNEPATALVFDSDAKLDTTVPFDWPSRCINELVSDGALVDSIALVVGPEFVIVACIFEEAGMVLWTSSTCVVAYRGVVDEGKDAAVSVLSNDTKLEIEVVGLRAD